MPVRTSRAAIVLMVSFGFGCVLPVDDEELVNESSQPLAVTAGWDFTLPEESPEPDAGIWAGPGATPGVGALKHASLSVTWAELNSAPNSFDWSQLTTALASARSANRKLVVRVMTINKSTGCCKAAVPSWVITECNPATAQVGSNSRNIVVAAPWNACLQTRFQQFTAAFGQKQFHLDPAFGGLYITGISDSYGEEMNITTSTAMTQLVQAGMTPETLRKAFVDRFDGWKSAFGSSSYKLVFQGGTTFNNDATYDAVLDALNEAAWQRGMGTRGGFLESSFVAQIDARVLGTGPLAPSGDYTIDPTHPLHTSTTPRYFGDEIENITNDPALADHTTRVLLLRALEMRMRWLWADGDVNRNADTLAVANYFNNVAGKSAETSPDAWTMLRSTWVTDSGACVKSRNFNRWLTADEVPGLSMTIDSPSSIPRAANRRDCGTQPSRDWNRVIASSDGSHSARFVVDRDWIPTGVSQDMELKVTFRANGAQFRVQHCSGAGVVDSATVATGSGNGYATVTVPLARMRSSHCLDAAHDLGIRRVSGAPELAFVRLIKRGDPVPDGPLLGIDTVGSGGSGGFNAGTAHALAYQATTTGNAREIAFYVGAASTTTNLQLGLYTDKAGQPGTLLARATVANPAHGGWVTATLSPSTVSVQAGTRYWLAFLSTYNTGGVSPHWSTSGALYPRRRHATKGLTALPATWITDSSGTNAEQVSFYVRP
jgi:hypothetical protein